MHGDYSNYRRQYTSKVTDVPILTGTQNYTGSISPRSANFTLYIQKITVAINTHATGVTVAFADQSSTTIKFGSFIDATAANLVPGTYVFDFGPRGQACGLGKAFDITQSAAGIAGSVHIEAYEKLGATVSIANAI